MYKIIQKTRMMRALEGLRENLMIPIREHVHDIDRVFSCPLLTSFVRRTVSNRKEDAKLFNASFEHYKL